MDNRKGDGPTESQQTSGLVENQRAGSPVVNRRGNAPMATRTFLIAGIAIALLIGVASVFLASGDPDGLESTTLVVQGQKTLTGDTPEDAEIDEEHLAGTYSYSSPMPDYTMGEKTGSLGGVVAILAGTLLSVVMILGAIRALRILSRPKEGPAKP